MATAKTSVKKAFATQTDLQDHREHCAPAASVLASLGSGPGQQVRIHRDDEFALYTVSELLHETTDSVVRMGLGGRQRLSRRRGSRGCWTRRSSIRTCPTKEARDAGELVERLDDDGSQTHLIAIAPHGGDIEEHTDHQAERVAERLGPQLASAWRGKGWRPDGGAFVRWHITSTDLNPACFPLLNSVMSRRFAHAVAFHGFDDEPGVLIGGTAPAELKERLRQAIEEVLPAGLDVRVALPTSGTGATTRPTSSTGSARAAASRSSRGATARDDHGCDIADAVADFFRPTTARREPSTAPWHRGHAGSGVGGGAVTRRPPAGAQPWVMTAPRLAEAANGVPAAHSRALCAARRRSRSRRHRGTMARILRDDVENARPAPSQGCKRPPGPPSHRGEPHGQVPVAQALPRRSGGGQRRPDGPVDARRGRGPHPVT